MTESRQSVWPAILRLLIRLAFVIAIAVTMSELMNWVEDATAEFAPATQKLMLNSFLVLVLAAYIVLIAVPFVPGIEIGISLIILRGAPIAPYVYLGTIIGLALAYFVGRHLPFRWLHRLLTDFRLHRIADFLKTIHDSRPDERIALLRSRLPGPLGQSFLSWRYLFLALLINIPGNALIGGGGGILMLAGLIKIFHPFTTMITVALAVMPVPLAVWIFGTDLIS